KLPDPHHERLHQRRRPAAGGHQEPDRDRHPGKLPQQHRRPPVRQVVGQRGQHPPRGHRRPPLHRRLHPPRRLPVTHPPATLTPAGHHLILDHPRRRRRRTFEHLPPLHPHHRRIGKIRAAPATPTRLHPDPLIRIINLPPGHPRLTRLLSRPTPRP